MAYKLKNIRILLLNDNLPLRNLIRNLLLDLGFGHVDVADHEAMAWQMYRDLIPDIIIVDWRMDKNREMELVRRIRSDYTSPVPHIPIIVVTGHTHKERVVYARDMGVTEFLTKPFTIQNLVKYLMHIIEKPRDFVIAPRFVGPDRRRRIDRIDHAELKRKKDTVSTASDYVPHTGPNSVFKTSTNKE